MRQKRAATTYPLFGEKMLKTVYKYATLTVTMQG